MKLLFVCLGNICRSPAAEGVMKKVVKDHGLQKKYEIDSAGTAAYHEGEKADSRMRKVGSSRGYTFDSISRPVVSQDFNNFDLIFAMDNSNYNNLMYQCPKKHQHKIHKMTDYCVTTGASEVPDPYYGGEKGFHRVIDILEDACGNLLNKLEQGTFEE
ncbi:acid phosphatase [Entamoeba marina]